MIYLPQAQDVFFMICVLFKPNLFGKARGAEYLVGRTGFVLVAVAVLLIVKYIRITITYLENKINCNNNNCLVQVDTVYFLE